MSLIDSYKVVTVTHHDLNVHEIANFYINPTDGKSKDDIISKLTNSHEITELIYLETCNRVSYIIYGLSEIDEKWLQDFFLDINPHLDSAISDSLKKFVTIYEGEQAVKHVFELASSMDSLVVGEREIFSQLRAAYNHCYELGTTGDFLRVLENTTVTTAKKIYSNTKIGEKALSIVSLAIRAMMERQPNHNQKILLVGSGETNSLVGKFLKKYNFQNVEIYNRSLDNAKTLSQRLDAPSFHLKDLIKAHDFDIIFICTSAQKVIIDLPLYQKMLNGDTSNKVIIDLSIPRNVSEEVVDFCNVDYIDIQCLKNIAEENLAFRKSELSKARPIIREELNAFRKKLQKRQIEKAISKLPTELSNIKDKAINIVYQKRMTELPDEVKVLVMEMMDYMEKKCVASTMRMSKEI